MTAFDAGKYKQGQLEQWDAVSAGWAKWWRTFEQGAGHISERLIDLAAIRPGHRVLDVATGIGEPAVSIGRRVGAKGRVVATDQSPGMLKLARQRAEDEGLSWVEFHEVDAERLSFDPNSFDAVTCRWGLMFMPDMQAALAKIHGVLKPGAKFSTAVWDVPEKMPMAGLALGIIKQMLNPPPPPPEAPSLFKLAKIELLTSALERAGFREIAVERQEAVMSAESASRFIEYIRDVAAPVVHLISQAPADKQKEVWAAIEKTTAERFGGKDGTVTIPNVTILVSATR